MLRFSFSASVWLLLIFAGVTWAQTSTEDAVRQRRAAFLKTINDRKPDEAMKFVADSLTVVEKGKTLTGKEARDRLKQIVTFAEGVTITSKIEKIELKGAAVILTAQDTVSQTGDDGVKREVTGRTRETWEKSGDRWLLVRNEEVPSP